MMIKCQCGSIFEYCYTQSNIGLKWRHVGILCYYYALNTLKSVFKLIHCFIFKVIVSMYIYCFLWRMDNLLTKGNHLISIYNSITQGILMKIIITEVGCPCNVTGTLNPGANVQGTAETYIHISCSMNISYPFCHYITWRTCIFWIKNGKAVFHITVMKARLCRLSAISRPTKMILFLVFNVSIILNNSV